MRRFNDLFRRKFSVVTKIAPPLYVGVGPAAKAAVEHYRPYRSTLASLKVRGVACCCVLPFWNNACRRRRVCCCGAMVARNCL